MGVTMIFPGQASQYVGMGKDLSENFPYVKELFERASAVLGIDTEDLCFYGPEERLQLTRNTQPAIFIVSVAAYEVLSREFGVKVKMSAGHSLGEYSALVCGGALSFEDAVTLLEKRGRYMQEAVPLGTGAMSAIIGFERDKVEEICNEVEGVVEIANLNGAGQIVISGERKPVLEAMEKARDLGAKRAIELAVSAPFHCSLMHPAAIRLFSSLEEVAFNDLEFPVVANVTARPYPGKEMIPPSLARQLYSPVKWEEIMGFFANELEGVLIEAGPGKVLTGLARRTMKGWSLASFGSLDDVSKVEKILN